MHKLIFLDIDGVLNSERYFKSRAFGFPGMISKRDKLDPDAVKILSDVIACTGAKIIISSTWRLAYSKREIATLLRNIAPFPPGTFGGVTPDHGVTGNRGDEIAHFLKRVSAFSYCIIDDMPTDGFTHEQRERHLVTTNYESGLLKSHVPKILNSLQVRVQA